VNLLLDTHVFLWWNAGDERLSDVARDAIADPGNRVLVSAVSAWEIVIKVGLGRLTVEGSPDVYVESRLRDNTFTGLSFTVEHSLGVAALPAHHRDPFDRALISQAAFERLTLVTADEIIRRYPVESLW
jgi:PIN domain nuclease of toxin-antitoxin system